MNPLSSPTHSLIGSVLTGTNGLKIKIERKIGAGSFGVVYLATHGRGKQVQEYAVKVIAPVTESDVQLSFENEIGGVAGLSSEHLLLPLDHGKCDVHGEQGFFIVYPYCTDGSYRERLAGRSAPVTPEAFAQVLLEIEQVLEGLSVLHTKTVHRDLKPENILVADETLLIGDFGLTKLVNDATRTLTFKGSGTASYMAPEVWNLQHIGVPADLYAVGVMLFEAMTGTRPFTGDTHELQQKHLYEPAPRARSVNKLTPAHVDGVIKKLLHKESSQRYQTAEEVLNALRAPVAAQPQAAIFVESMQRHHDAEELKRLEEDRARKAKSDAAARNAYMEQEVLDMFEEAVTSINSVSPDAQIQVAKSHSSETTYSFANRKLEIGFYSSGSFPHEDPRGPKYGYAEQLHQGHIVHGGYVGVEVDGQPRIGWNLALKRVPESGYGEWRFVVVEFGLTNKRFINGSMPLDSKMLTESYGQKVGRVTGIYNVHDTPFTAENVQMMLQYLMPTTKLNGTEAEERRRRGRGFSDDYFDTY